MVRAKLDETTFIELFETKGPTEVARAGNINLRNVFARRASLEKKLGRKIEAPLSFRNREVHIHPKRIELAISDGVVLIGSDGHYWPEEVSVAHRAFVKFAKDMAPKAVIMNGDVFDGASISRFPPIGWTHQPTVQEEIETCQERLDEVIKAKPKSCRTIHTLGNHDARFEGRIATVAPEFAKVMGTSLSDHFPLWEKCWSVAINDDVIIKHRFKGGIHATRNNVLNAGRTMITGHLHSAKVSPISDYNGTRWGVDTGCLADPDADAFSYTEDNPKDWRSGFCVLTFKGGQLLWPELVTKHDENSVQFRGEVIKV